MFSNRGMLQFRPRDLLQHRSQSQLQLSKDRMGKLLSKVTELHVAWQQELESDEPLSAYEVHESARPLTGHGE